MRNVTFRIGMWAVIGLMIAFGWGLYFTTGNKSVPVEPVVYSLARLTQPVVAMVLYFNPDLPLGLTVAMVGNAAAYALVGLVVEIRRRERLTAFRG
jgi:hypothetical protein